MSVVWLLFYGEGVVVVLGLVVCVLVESLFLSIYNKHEKRD